MFEAEYALGGLSPALYHSVSLVLHVANTILLYALYPVSDRAFVDPGVGESVARTIQFVRLELPSTRCIPFAWRPSPGTRASPICSAVSSRYRHCWPICASTSIGFYRVGLGLLCPSPRPPGPCSPRPPQSSSPSVIAILDVYACRIHGGIRATSVPTEVGDVEGETPVLGGVDPLGSGSACGRT